jgi:hypothetical protein
MSSKLGTVRAWLVTCPQHVSEIDTTLAALSTRYPTVPDDGSADATTQLERTIRSYGCLSLVIRAEKFNIAACHIERVKSVKPIS